MYIETTLPLESNNQGEIEVLIVTDYEQAQAALTDCYGRALEVAPDSVEARIGRAFCHRAVGYGYMASLSRLKAAADETPAAFKERKFEARRMAMEEFRAALRLAPESEHFGPLKVILSSYARELHQKALQAYDEVRHEDALMLIERALRFDDTDVENHVLAARIENDLGHWKEAARAYKAALSRDPEHLRALFEMSKLEYTRRHWRSCMEHGGRFLAVVAKEPANPALEEFASAARKMVEKAKKELEQDG